MRILSILFATIALLFITSCLVISTGANAKKEVVLVQFLHRHGARTPIVPESLAASVCGKNGCGELIHNGEMMLVALGEWLRSRYATQTMKPSPTAVDVSADFKTAFGDDESYSITHMHTRSTDVNRTIQSAAGVIRGFAPNISTYYPIVHTVANEHDTLLLSDNALSMTIPFMTKNNPCFNDKPKAAVLEKQYVSIKKLQNIATSLKLAGHLTCHELTGESDAYEYGECILPMWDTIMSYIAMGGRLDNTSDGIAEIPQMAAFDAAKRACTFVDTTPDQGAISYDLVDMYINNMNIRANEAKKNGFGPHTKLVYEYSAHDTTVAPFMVALGFPEKLLPNFGQVIITEMVNDTETGELTLRHWYGEPRTIWPPLPPATSTPDWYRYDNNMTELPVFCWDTATNSVKNVTDGSCTLEEFTLYAKNVLKGKKDGGAYCYLSKDMLKKIHCDEAAAPSPDDHPACYTYRKACPRYACPDGYTVNTETLACLPTRFVPVVSSEQAFAIASGTTVGGIVLGIAGTFITRALLSGKHL